MNINNKILSIPPYISTSWKNIASLHVEQGAVGFYLVITLITGNRIEIPHLEDSLLETIFTAHARHLEEESSAKSLSKQTGNVDASLFSFPMKMPGPGELPEGMTPLIGHNQEQADAPDLPQEMLNKISSIAKVVAGNNLDQLPKPEPHCNCPFCQIARAIQENGKESEREEALLVEEPVSAADLQFSDWFIEQTGDRLFSVTNPLDRQENYHVYLGEPIGCTCGHADCEHVKAVLRS